MSVTDDIKARIDIVDFVGRYVDLKRSGANYKGLCPFHNERTPSFVVNQQRGTWHCFGACATGGDVFDFLMRHEHLGFRDALRRLAAEAGVEVTPDIDGQTARQHERLYDANQATAAYFQDALRHSAAAQEYLAGRGIDEASIERFGIGYAPAGWTHLRDHLVRRGYPLETIVEAGLVKRHPERDSVYDVFRDRVTFPIRDRQGRICGFSGRLIADQENQPKYLNTPETPIFQKTRMVYGLDLAYTAIREQNQVVVVEGYLDVIAAHQLGFCNVVAAMGTALTVPQLQQLQRYTNTFVLALDADTAGQQATLRGLNAARQALRILPRPTVTARGVRFESQLGALIYIVALPPGQDPDDVIRENPSRWQEMIARAQPLVSYFFDLILSQEDVSTAEGKKMASDELMALIQDLADPVERDHYLQRLGRVLGLNERTLADRLRAVVNRRQPQPEREGVEAVFGSEDYMLTHFLLHPGLLEWIDQALTAHGLPLVQQSDWRHVENLEIYRWLRRWVRAGEPWDLILFQEMLPNLLQERINWLMLEEVKLPPVERDQIGDEILKTLARLRLARQREWVQQARSVGGDITGPAVQRHMAEMAVLTRMIQETPGVGIKPNVGQATE